MTTPSFDTLRSAAERGPVIIINHSKWHLYIIILLRDSPPSLIPTADNFYERAKHSRDQLLSARNHSLESGAYDDALRSILESLYHLVGRPVIQRLHDLNVPEQSRIWFCPTSVFCSLPLHAMGHVKFYFSDLYAPSYTPTLSALIGSRKPRAQPRERPSVLLVIQPDAKMSKALHEMRVIQSVGPVNSDTSLGNSNAERCAGTPQRLPICPRIMSWQSRDRKPVRHVFHTVRRPTSHATRHRAIEASH